MWDSHVGQRIACMAIYILSEILSGSIGVYFSEVLKYTDVQKYTNQNSRLNFNPGERRKFVHDF
jgi:hypothetical protein